MKIIDEICLNLKEEKILIARVEGQNCISWKKKMLRIIDWQLKLVFLIAEQSTFFYLQ